MGQAGWETVRCMCVSGPAQTAKRETNFAVLTCFHYDSIFFPALEEGDSCLEEQGFSFLMLLSLLAPSLFCCSKTGGDEK